MAVTAKTLAPRMGAARMSLNEIAQNLANVDTPGFKRYVSAFGTNSGEAESPARIEPGRSASQPAVDRIRKMDLTPGELRHTGRRLDLAIEGATDFFGVRTPDGLRYTRHGRFRVNEEGLMVNPHGHALAADVGTLQLPPDTREVSIDASGNVTADGQRIGQITVYRFQNADAIRPVGQNLYLSGDPAPEPTRDATVLQGTLEESNVKAMHELVRLISASRSYENSSRMLRRLGSVKRQIVDKMT